MEVRHKGHFEALALDTCHCSTQGMHPITAWQDAHAAAGNDTVLRQMEHLKIDFNTLEASSSGEGALGFSEVGKRCSTKSSSSSALLPPSFSTVPGFLFSPSSPFLCPFSSFASHFLSPPEFFGCSSRTVTLFKIDKKCPPLYV